MYSILKPLVKLTLNSYFKNFKIQGQENIPTDRPVIFLANHPSAFMDPLVVAAVVPQKLHFLAAAEYFGKGLKFAFCKKQLNMIPVYRPTTLPNQTYKNDGMFSACYEHLKNQGSLLMFPEGNSITEERLRDIKTGAARIALGSLTKERNSKDVVIIPIGLNYTSPHEFRSDVVVKVGEVINVREFEQDDNKIAVRNLTNHISESLIDCIVHIQNPEDEALLNCIEDIYSTELIGQLDLEKEPETEFQIRKDTALAIKYFDEKEEPGMKDLKSRIINYCETKKKNGFENQDNNESSDKKINPFSLFLRIPIFLTGFALNAVPYFLTKFIARLFDSKSSFFGSLLMAVGMFIFLFYYFSVGLLIVVKVKYILIALAFPFISYFFGIGSLKYISDWKQLNNLIKVNSQFSKNLQTEKVEIVNELKKYRLLYVDRNA